MNHSSEPSLFFDAFFGFHETWIRSWHWRWRRLNPFFDEDSDERKDTLNVFWSGYWGTIVEDRV
jgi:hypothetical protein